MQFTKQKWVERSS